MLQILLEPVGEHLCAGAQWGGRRSLVSHCCAIGAARRSQIDAQESTGDGAVIYLVYPVAAQAQLARHIASTCENGSLPARKALTQHAPELGMHFAGLLDIAEALAIRGIGANQPAASAQGLHLPKTEPIEAHQRGDSGALGISRADGQGARINITAADQACNRGARACLRLIEQALPERGVMAAPAQKPEIIPMQRRGALGCDQCGLDHQCARAAQRIEEFRAARCILIPTRAQQQTRGEILAHRRLAGLGAITAPMQTLTGQVDRERDVYTLRMSNDPYCRAHQRHIRPRADDSPCFDRTQHGHHVADDRRRRRRAARARAGEGQRAGGASRHANTVLRARTLRA